MTIPLKLYVIASRGFVARLNRIDTNKRPSATQERESIRRDMTDFCKEAGDSAPIPASLFDCLTELCRSIDKGEIDVPNLRNEAGWNKIVDYLMVQGPAVDLDTYRDTICRFLWSYLEPHPTTSTELARASRSTITTAQQSSDASLAPAPMPEPSHVEISTAPKSRPKLTPEPLLEDRKS